MQPIEPLVQLIQWIKNRFIGKDEIVELLALSLVAGENTFLLGPPGTAKSALIRSWSYGIEGGVYFEYLLSKFTEPNELFGPFDIRRLREGTLVLNTEGMLPEASLVFLDEIFNANSAILNSLLNVLNEKMLRRGKEVIKLPTVMFVGASNALPEDDTLKALLDRFLVRIPCGYVEETDMEHLLQKGRGLEVESLEQVPKISIAAIREWQRASRAVSMEKVMPELLSLLNNIKKAGIPVSDRRAVKIQNLLAASALICAREEALPSDLWVLKYIWDTELQKELLDELCKETLQKCSKDHAHPMAFTSKNEVSPELLMNELQQIEAQLTLSIDETQRSIIKDRLRTLQSRAAWVLNPTQQNFILQKIENLWSLLLQTNQRSS